MFRYLDEERWLENYYDPHDMETLCKTKVNDPEDSVYFKINETGSIEERQMLQYNHIKWRETAGLYGPLGVHMMRHAIHKACDGRFKRPGKLLDDVITGRTEETVISIMKLRECEVPQQPQQYEANQADHFASLPPKKKRF